MNPQPKNKPMRLKGAKLTALYDYVKERDNSRCVISGVFTTDNPHHIVFRSQGGSDIAENLATLDYDSVHYYIHHGTDKGKDHVIDLIASRYGDMALQYCGVGDTIAEVVKDYGRNKFIQMFLLGIVKESCIMQNS